MTASVREEIDEVVIGYLARHVQGPEPGRDDDLFMTGRLSSLFVIELIAFLERQFAIKVSVEDLDLAHFATVNKIVDLVVRKQNGA